MLQLLNKIPEQLPKVIPEEKITYEETTTRLPDNFPADFPIYPGAKIVSSWTNEGDTDIGVSVIWETDDQLNEVKDYYSTNLKSNGWMVSNEASTDGSVVLSFVKGETQGFMGLSREDMTAISVTLGLKK